MKHPNQSCGLFAASLLLLAATIVGCAPQTENGPPGKPETHVIVLYDSTVAGHDVECFGRPDTTYANPRDFVLFTTETDTATVKDLAVNPNSGRRLPLTAVGRFGLRRNEFAGARIHPNARGVYSIPVQCGNSPDDPPKIIVPGM